MHPWVITIFIGGICTIPTWVVYYWFAHVLCLCIHINIYIYIHILFFYHHQKKCNKHYFKACSMCFNALFFCVFRFHFDENLCRCLCTKALENVCSGSCGISPISNGKAPSIFCRRYITIIVFATTYSESSCPWYVRTSHSKLHNDIKMVIMWVKTIIQQPVLGMVLHHLFVYWWCGGWFMIVSIHITHNNMHCKSIEKLYVDEVP